MNSIASGYYHGELTTKQSDRNQKSQIPQDKIEEKVHVPMNRVGSDEELAQAVIS